MLTLTPTAAEAVRRLVDSAPTETAEGLRIAPGHATAEGTSLEITVVDGPELDDQEVRGGRRARVPRARGGAVHGGQGPRRRARGDRRALLDPRPGVLRPGVQRASVAGCHSGARARHAVRRRAARRPPERRGDAVSRGPGRALGPPGRHGASARRGRELREPEARAADGRRRGRLRGARATARHDVRGARAQPQGARARAGRRRAGDPHLLRRDRLLQPPQPERERRGVGGRHRGDDRDRARGRPHDHRDAERRVRLPVRGPRRPRAS